MHDDNDVASDDASASSTSDSECTPLPARRFPVTERSRPPSMADAVAGPSGPSDSQPTPSGPVVSTTQPQGDRHVAKKPRDKGKKKA
jgi:hypothetical protein